MNMSHDNLMLHWWSPEGRTTEATQREERATEDCRGGESTERYDEVILNTKTIRQVRDGETLLLVETFQKPFTRRCEQTTKTMLRILKIFYSAIKIFVLLKTTDTGICALLHERCGLFFAESKVSPSTDYEPKLYNIMHIFTPLTGPLCMKTCRRVMNRKYLVKSDHLTCRKTMHGNQCKPQRQAIGFKS